MAPGSDSSGRGIAPDYASAALAAMSEGVVVQLAGGEIVSCNPAAERILGLTRDRMAGRTSLDPGWRAIHEDGSPFPGETHPAMVTLRTGEAQRNVVMGVHAPDGSLRWISINTEPIPSRNGGACAVVVTIADVTGQRRTEAVLQESERKYRLLAENAADVIGILGMDGVVRWASPSCERLTGYTQDEMIGSRPSEIILLEDRPEVERARSRHLAGDDLVRVRFRVIRKDGKLIWVERTTRAIRKSAAGEIVELQFCVRNVTEAKEYEAKLLRNNERLEKMVQDRTVKLVLANEELRTAVAANLQAIEAIRQSK